MFKKLGDYGFTCSSPKRVFNKFSKEWLTVPCGRCAACAKTYSNRLVSMINNASRSSAVTYFVTLTYSPHNLPWCEFDLNDVDVVTNSRVTNWRYRSRVPVVTDFNTHFALPALDMPFFDKGMPSISDSSYLGRGRFGVLVKSDLQKFIKRFRKLFSYAFPETSFKYFAVGEYGSVTFRPHYHILIFSSDVLPYSRLSSFLNMSWKLGFVDFQISKGSVASYLGSYLSCSTPLPVFLRQDFDKPFYLHSAFKTYALTSSQEKEFFKRAYEDRITQIAVETPTGLALLPYPSSYRNRLFPKCSRFNQRTINTLLQILQRYGNACAHCDLPRFKVAVVQSIFRDVIDGLDTDTVVEYQYLTLSEIRDAYLNEDSKYKKIRGTRLFDSRDYLDIYASFKVHQIALLLNTSDYFVAKRIIEYYKGSSSDFGDNYALQLLKLQYDALELCDSEDEVRFLYSFYNSQDSRHALLEAGLSDKPIPLSVVAHFNDIVSLTCVKSIKHKERNSYYQYIIHHKS